MAFPRSQASLIAGANRPDRLPLALALLVILIALPAVAQRPLGSFSDNRRDDRGATSEDVLPFAQESSGELLPAAETAPEASPEKTIEPAETPSLEENPWAQPPQANVAPANGIPISGPAAAEGEKLPVPDTAATVPQTDTVPAPAALPMANEPFPRGPATPKIESPAAEPPSEPVANAAPWIPQPKTVEPSPAAADEIKPPRATNKPETSASASATSEKEDVVLVAAEQAAPAEARAVPAALPAPGPVAAAATPAAKDAGEATEKPAAKMISNPFAWRNLLQWCLDHGPKLLAILVGMYVLQFFAKIFSQRIVSVVARGGARGTKEEREDRAQTLVGVFHNAASMIIVVGSVLMACEEVGIAVGPLIGGAAVLGLAAAFGAQNLIRDYFSGFMILLENQYRINDIIEVNGVSGQVERITMRITVLRDLEGNVHFVPNGKIETVTNMSHGWSRAMLVIRIAYKEDADRVMELLLTMAAELREDPAFGPLILDDAEMLGVDSLGDSAVNIKFVMKTKPLKQWAVKRELLRRVKRRFDELKIEIPFPHRTIFHQNAEAGGSAKEAATRSWESDRAA